MTDDEPREDVVAWEFQWRSLRRGWVTRVFQEHPDKAVPEEFEVRNVRPLTYLDGGVDAMDKIAETGQKLAENSRPDKWRDDGGGDD